MRLIETTTLAMETHEGNIPCYAILSHTWEDEEVTLQDWNSPTRSRMKGFHKIRMTCQLASYSRIKYAWVDTCCIDKTNSAELSEAINSMYKWYNGATICYAYLSDLHVPISASESTSVQDLTPLLRRCRWFSRGWTLQELIAPFEVLFYQHNWGLVGKKTQWYNMLSDITGISSSALISYSYPAQFSIAERMSWAAGRETTRDEDVAYCLLGIFNVNMPMLYGEGTKAFRRLQEEIIRTGYDVTIFAWTDEFYRIQSECYDNYFSSAFAEAPGDFHFIPADLIRRQWNEVSVTNAGVKLNLEVCLARMPQTGELSYVLPVCAGFWRDTGVVFGKQYMPALAVGLEMIGSGRFARKSLGNLVEISDSGEAGMIRRVFPDAYILTDVDSGMLLDLSAHDSHHPCFEFPPGCRVVNAWPSASWNDAKGRFMTDLREPDYGSLLLEVRSPILSNDGFTTQYRTGEFMFLFSCFPGSNDDMDVSDQELQCTIVGYREHQLILDIINMRLGAGGMDAKEMRRTLRNYAIPRQRTAAVLVEGAEQNIYTSAEFDLLRGYTFKSSSVALENVQKPWRV
ncbi:Vegetative incompatibility protein HET-E-1 [Colletotrichum siamense]|nr:Vegetative incompatibility protein HET-E-1 [Colletotrichum siamense]